MPFKTRSTIEIRQSWQLSLSALRHGHDCKSGRSGRCTSLMKGRPCKPKCFRVIETWFTINLSHLVSITTAHHSTSDNSIPLSLVFVAATIAWRLSCQLISACTFENKTCTLTPSLSCIFSHVHMLFQHLFAHQGLLQRFVGQQVDMPYTKNLAALLALALEIKLHSRHERAQEALARKLQMQMRLARDACHKPVSCTGLHGPAI